MANLCKYTLHLWACIFYSCRYQESFSSFLKRNKANLTSVVAMTSVLAHISSPPSWLVFSPLFSSSHLNHHPPSTLSCLFLTSPSLAFCIPPFLFCHLVTWGLLTLEVLECMTAESASTRVGWWCTSCDKISIYSHKAFRANTSFFCFIPSFLSTCACRDGSHEQKRVLMCCSCIWPSCHNLSYRF